MLHIHNFGSFVAAALLLCSRVKLQAPLGLGTGSPSDSPARQVAPPVDHWCRGSTKAPPPATNLGGKKGSLVIKHETLTTTITAAEGRVI